MDYAEALRARLADDEEALRRAKRAKDATAIGIAEGRIAHARAAAKAAGVKLDPEPSESPSTGGRRPRAKDK